MPSSRTIVWLGAVLISSATVTHAADINGVWASDTAVCNKVFTKKGGRVSFAKDADIHGSGFILDRVRSAESWPTARSKRASRMATLCIWSHRVRRI